MFAPSVLMSAATAVLLILFVSLGRWQWGRYEAKRPVWEAFERGSDPAVPLGAAATTGFERFAHVRVSGRWDGARQFVLDNRSLAGRPGYEILTPLLLADGRVLLVNRGWVPFGGYRERLPEIALPEAEGGEAGIVTLAGRLDELPSRGLESGRAPPAMAGQWPRVTSFPQAGELAAALGTQRLERRILLLDPSDPAPGFERRWRPPGVAPDTHWGYAIQWWGFAVVLMVLYLGLNSKKRTLEAAGQ